MNFKIAIDTPLRRRAVTSGGWLVTLAAALALSWPEAALGHAVSIGYENAGPGSVTIWLGTYDHGADTVEGSLNLVGVLGNPFPSTTVPFSSLVSGLANKPAGLADGVTNFYSDWDGNVPNNLPLVDTEAAFNAGCPACGPVEHWQGVTFVGLSAGFYQFTYVPIGSPSSEWTPLSLQMNGIFDLTVVLVCGDSMVQGVEECDDGNTADGDCCSSTCQYEPDGSPCIDDGNVCTDDQCDGSGACQHPNNNAACEDDVFCNGADTCSGGLCSTHDGDPCPGPDGDGNCAESCDDATDMCTAPDIVGSACASDGNMCTKDVCDGSGNCGLDIPALDCRTAAKSILLLKNNADDTKDKLTFKWLKGAETMLGELGDPTGATNYTLCLYAGSTSATVAMPAGSNWKTLGTKGFKLKDSGGAPDGARKAVLKSGAAGKAKVLVKGKGVNLPNDLVPQLPLPVTAQVVNDANSTCFEAVYDSGDVIKNDEKQFKAKAQ